MPTPTPPPPRTALQWMDLVIGVLLTVIGGLTGLVMLTFVNQLGALSAECEGIAEAGARCSPGFLSGMIILGTAIVIFAWFLGLGFLIVRAVRRRVAFFVPLIAFAVMVAGFYLITALLAANYVPAT